MNHTEALQAAAESIIAEIKKFPRDSTGLMGSMAGWGATEHDIAGVGVRAYLQARAEGPRCHHSKLFDGCHTRHTLTAERMLADFGDTTILRPFR